MPRLIRRNGHLREIQRWDVIAQLDRIAVPLILDGSSISSAYRLALGQKPQVKLEVPVKKSRAVKKASAMSAAAMDLFDWRKTA